MKTSGAEIRMMFPEAALTALCDANRLEQVFVNLLGNALDAMVDQQAPVIEISASESREMICLYFAITVRA